MYAIRNIEIENRSIHDSYDQSISLAALTYLDQLTRHRENLFDAARDQTG
jgi:hypothetical protein